MIVMPTTFFDPSQLEAAERLDYGVELANRNMFAEALVEFEAVLKIDPYDRHARWNRVFSLLCLGDYTNGLPDHDFAWDLYDWRLNWRARGTVQGNIERALDLPKWRGDKCKVLAYHEMGFGDAIMTLRFLSELVSRCESLTLVVRPELVTLMQGYGANVVDRVPQDISGFDARVTFFNSIFTMGHSKETIPSAPYVEADFGFSGGKMGIVWSGNSQKVFNVDSFLSRLDTQGFELYALQKADPVEGVVTLESKDFKETIKTMERMDCIVTVDTSSAHLAGAIGHPNVHLILPYFRDWRWWNKDIWYPKINLYPQDHPDDWDTPFKRVNKVLHG